MKKYILSLFLLGFLLAPAFSFAQVGDIDPNPTASDCVALQNNLRYKDRDINKNGEVSTLQDFLQSKNYLNSEPTGYFGLLTQKAVKSFQKDSDISPTGYVGPVTRAKIKALSCGGDVSNSDLISFSISPNTKLNGMVSFSGIIKGAYFFEGEAQVNILNLNKKVLKSNYITAKGEWMNSGPVSFEGSIDLTGLSNGSAYIEIHNGNMTGLSKFDKSVLVPIIITSLTDDGCLPGDIWNRKTGHRCDETTPVISGVSGPQTLNINQTGTWTVTASDSSGGNLSYSVVWGDEGNIYPVAMPRYDNIQQTATFYHSYVKAGVYEPTFTVKNTSGQSAKTSLSVNIGSTVSTNHNPVLNPIAIPTPISVGQSVNLNFSATDADNDDLSWSTNWGDNTPVVLVPCSIPSRQTGAGWNYAIQHTWSTVGTYTVKVTVYDCRGGTADTSFSVNVGNTVSTNHNPVLNPIAIPTPISVGQSVNFNFSATDADNDDLGWNINWGDDDNSGSTSGTCSIENGKTWGFNTNHIWKNVGTYTVKVTVSDCKGGTASTNFNVNVGSTVTKNSVSLNSALGSQSANVLDALDNSNDKKTVEANTNNSQKLVCGEFTLTLKKGMKNEEVKCLQKMLNEKGFKVEGVEKGMETTYFGSATLAALKAFQSSGKLAIDGVFGPASRVALKAITQ
ncbi:MAG: peptidoglycan-binding protein [Candidatus Paceibacterota bacterium]